MVVVVAVGGGGGSSNNGGGNSTIWLCIMRAHIFGPNFQGKKSFILIFNSIIYLFIFGNKTGHCTLGYYFAYGYQYCFLELYF